MNDLAEITAQQHYPMARRGFVMTSLISGFTLATTVVEAQAIHTDTAGLDAGEVQIPVKDGNLPAYYARPATGTGFPVILVNEEVFGVKSTSGMSVAASPSRAISLLRRRSTPVLAIYRRPPTARKLAPSHRNCLMPN